MNAFVKFRAPAFNNVLFAVLGSCALLGATSPVTAADAASVRAHQEREQERREKREERAAPAPAQQSAPAPAVRAPQAAPAPRAQGANDNRRGGNRDYNNRGNGSRDYRNANGDPVIVGPPRGNQGPSARILPPSRIQGYRPPPPARVVPRLPPGYNSYHWRGSPYYNYRGSWYRPYRGGSYVIVGAPYGMFVSSLPSYHSSVWFGGSRYYYADDTYYMYEPQRRGYVITRSPYDARDDEDDYESGSGDDSYDEDLYVYPTRGQSEKQQADDRYECHRWAVDQTRYDPTDSDYDSEDREQYDRAITACLSGRGYSVK